MGAFLAAKFGGLWAKLLAGGAILLGLGALVLRFMGVMRQAGEDKQAVKDLTAGMKEATDANRARNAVGASDADVERMLRPPRDRQ